MVVQGYLLDFLIPSEERLGISLDVTDVVSEERYGLLRQGLEKLMEEIDLAYAKMKPRGRSLKGKYRRTVFAKEVGERKVLRFSPFPSTFANDLRSLRRTWYRELNRHTIVLARGRETGTRYVRTRCLYMLPKAKAKEFMTVVIALNERIERLNKTIKDYETSADYQNICDWLEKVTKNKVPRNHVFIPPIDLAFYEIHVATGIVEEYVKGKESEAVARIEQAREDKLVAIKGARERGLKRVEYEIERTKQNMVRQAVMDLQGRFGQLVEKLAIALATKMTKKKAKALRESLDDLQSLAEAAGVGYFVRSVTETSIKLIDVMTLEKKKEKKKALEEAAEALASEAGIEPYETPEETIKVSARALTTGLSARAKALLGEVL